MNIRLLFSVFLLCLIFNLNAQQYELSLKLNKNEVYFHTMKADLEIFEKNKGKTSKSQSSIESTVQYKVEKSTKNGYILDARYTTMKISITAKGETIVHDSENTNNDLTSIILEGLTNTSFKIYLSNYGKIEKVTGIDILIKNTILGLPNLNELQKNQIISEFSKSFGDDNFAGNFELITSLYCDMKIETNGSWNVETEISSDKINNLVQTTYTLREIKDEYFLIVGEGTLTPLINSKKEITMKETSTSEYRLDKNSGWLLYGKINQIIRGHQSKFDEDDKENYSFMNITTSYHGGLVK